MPLGYTTRGGLSHTCYLRAVPFARLLVFVLALTHAVGLADLVLEDACAEACSDDGCEDDCLPGVACRCHCPSVLPMIGGAAKTVDAPSVRVDVVAAWAVERVHASPDPLEILHVPKHRA